ncbi:hypothetical protein MRX96_046382 [Rhipicephalus microplus]
MAFLYRTKLLGLTVKFSSDTQKIFVYEPNLTIVEAFGYMGGYLGMWLGFSLLSILKGLEEKILDFFFGSRPGDVHKDSKVCKSIRIPKFQDELALVYGGAAAGVAVLHERLPVPNVGDHRDVPAIPVHGDHHRGSAPQHTISGTDRVRRELTLAEDVYQIQFEPEMRQRIALEQRDLFRCSMRSTVSSCFSFNCLEVKVLQLQSTDKLPLVIHRSETCPPDRLSSITVKPGLTYTVSVAQQTVRRLPPPFASRCSDYKAAGKKDEFLGYLTQDLCIQECLIKQEIKLCNCIRPLHEYGSNFNVPTCGYQNTATSFFLCVASELIEAFGCMGGYIGMWLGLSLYSLITDAEKWLRDFFLQKALKRKAAFEMSNAQQQPRIFTTSDYPAWRSNPRLGDWGSIRNVDSSPKILLPPSYK